MEAEAGVEPTHSENESDNLPLVHSAVLKLNYGVRYQIQTDDVEVAALCLNQLG